MKYLIRNKFRQIISFRLSTQRVLHPYGFQMLYFVLFVQFRIFEFRGNENISTYRFTKIHLKCYL